jgi:hypothetical protein
MVDLAMNIEMHGDAAWQLVPNGGKRWEGGREQGEFEPDKFIFHFRFPFFLLIKSRIHPSESSSTVVSSE